MSCWIKIFSRLHNIKLTAIATHLQAFRLDQLKNYFCHIYCGPKFSDYFFFILFKTTNLEIWKSLSQNMQICIPNSNNYLFPFVIWEGHIRKLNCKLFYGVLQFTCFGFMIAQANIYWESFLRKKNCELFMEVHTRRVLKRLYKKKSVRISGHRVELTCGSENEFLLCNSFRTVWAAFSGCVKSLAAFLFGD